MDFSGKKRERILPPTSGGWKRGRKISALHLFKWPPSYFYSYTLPLVAISGGIFPRWNFFLLLPPSPPSLFFSIRKKGKFYFFSRHLAFVTTPHDCWRGRSRRRSIKLSKMKVAAGTSSTPSDLLIDRAEGGKSEGFAKFATSKRVCRNGCEEKIGKLLPRRSPGPLPKNLRASRERPCCCFLAVLEDGEGARLIGC